MKQQSWTTLEEHWTIWGMDGITVIMIIIFCTVSLIFVSFSIRDWTQDKCKVIFPCDLSTANYLLNNLMFEMQMWYLVNWFNVNHSILILFAC